MNHTPLLSDSHSLTHLFNNHCGMVNMDTTLGGSFTFLIQVGVQGRK